MKRIALFIVGALGVGIGVFLFRNPIESEMLTVGDREIESPLVPLFMNWSLRLLFFGGGMIAAITSLFGSNQSIAKAFKGLKRGI